MLDKTRIRRNIHTYPFKYEYVDDKHFFAPDTAVIYIHIPFCNTKCHFCDYVVYTNTSQDLREEYVQALCKEISAFPENRAFPSFRIDAVYVGGGTPGLLTAEQLTRILDTVRATFEMEADCEVAVEFDPGCVERDKLKAVKDAGYTRMSIGVQTFSEELLKANNRPHDLASVYAAWEAIEDVGFEHTNIDLIYPLIGLDLATWRDSLSQAIGMAPTCITAYPLEVWPKTAYHNWLIGKHNETLPEPVEEMEMCQLAFDMLEQAGYRRYSTSGYYHPGRFDTYCRYLEYYWRTWPLIGFGVSSKSVIYDRLYANIRPIKKYIERVNAGESILDFATRMNRDQEMRRVMIRGLKMCEVSRADFRARFGVPMETVFGREIEDLIARDLIAGTEEDIHLTRRGQMFSTNVYETFYTEDDLRKPEEGEVQFGISELVMS